MSLLSRIFYSTKSGEVVSSKPDYDIFTKLSSRTNLRLKSGRNWL